MYENLQILQLTGAVLTIVIMISVVLYVYLALVLMTIAKKTNTKNPWLAWIPIANTYLMTQIGRVPWWTILIVLFAVFIPFVGGLISLVITLWWWAKIAEARGKPAWLGLIMIIPIVNLVIMGLLAWSD